MNVQQPAVSAAIKELEASFGLALFNRRHRRVELTAAGRRLFTDVAKALGEIETSAMSVRRLGLKEHVTLSSSSAFAYYWMMPRLKLLHQEHPAIEVRLQSSDREPDIDAEGISLAIRRGTGEWVGCHSALMAEEVIYPVASPGEMHKPAPLRDVGDLLSRRLIHLEEPIRERPTWTQWFASFDHPYQEPSEGLRLNDYALVLQAAIAGEGIAFGWHHVVQGLLGQNLLTARPEWSWRTGQGFYLVWSKRTPLSPSGMLVRDWMIKTADEDRS